MSEKATVTVETPSERSMSISWARLPISFTLSLFLALYGILTTPLIAGLLHYQFVTIHPYYDGNGRTARLLATFMLHRGGYGLQGLFSLEEFHARGNVFYAG